MNTGAIAMMAFRVTETQAARLSLAPIEDEAAPRRPRQGGPKTRVVVAVVYHRAMGHERQRFARTASFATLLLVGVRCEPRSVVDDVGAMSRDASAADTPLVDAPAFDVGPPDAWPPVCEPTTRPTGLVVVTGTLGAGEVAPIAAADFCVAFADAICSSDCGCETSPTCADRARDHCAGPSGALNPSTLAAIDDGVVTYDGLAAARVVAGIRDSMQDCARQPTVVLVDLLAATGAVYGPRLAPDGNCDPSNRWPCERGSRCAYEGDFSFRCRPAPAPPGECSSFGLCVFGSWVDLRCAGAGCNLGAGPGEECMRGRCVTDCDGRYCRCELPLGAPCVQERLCASGHCREGVCAPAPRLGDPCVAAAGCGEGVCEDGLCVARACGFADVWQLLPYWDGT